MKSTNDNPIDPLGQLGKAIKPAAPAKPDPVREFELIGDTNKAVQSIADTLRKKAQVQPGHVEEWAGLDFADAYSRALLGCI